jgi:glycerol-3-phosphate O-acyltransferase
MLADLRRPDSPSVVSGDAIDGEVLRRVLERVLGDGVDGVDGSEERLEETLYCEGQRLAHEPASPRTTGDRAFLAGLRHDLVHAGDHRRHELVADVVGRYLEEIGGTFDPRIYQLATQAIPAGFTAVLRHLGWAHDKRLEDLIRIEGEVDTLVHLADHATFVLAPSHVSNLDSVLLGWAIHHLGLPPFAYGAGLNLFSNAVIGFFMRNLGAYTVDRKKSDPLYRSTLKEYATVLLEHGQHSLFFPGGTRSRSGGVETKLKLGLLGTASVAFRRGLEAGRRRPVYVVPCTLTYPLVLEAASLSADYLRTEGQGRWFDRRDEFDRPRRWIDYLRGFLELDLAIHLRFGRPMDVVGNPLDETGASLDPGGRRVDPGGYFALPGGEVGEDAARDAEYTRLLGRRLIEAYRRDTVALPTGVVAFAVFEHLRRERSPSDAFRLLASIGKDSSVRLDAVVADVARLTDELLALDAAGRLVASAELRAGAEIVVRRALAAFETYHARPVLELSDGQIVVSDAPLLFYYRNRFDQLGLLGAPRLLARSSS